MNVQSNLTQSQIKEWWFERRLNYNLGLVVSGILAFILYVFLGVNLIMPFDFEFEITLFTIIFQGIGYLIMILMANIFYTLGSVFDLKNTKENTKENPEKYRKKLYNLGFWFSVSIPFLAPIMIVISYFLNYY